MQRGERGRVTTGVAVVIGGALVGVLIGWFTLELTRPEPVPTDRAHPLPATSPSVPTDAPQAPYAEDVDIPALPPDLDYLKARLGSGSFAWTYRVPKGWQVTVIGPSEQKSVPRGNPVGGYGLRLELVLGQRLSTADQVRTKLSAFRSLFEDVKVQVRTDDTIGLSYRDPGANWLRFNTFRWIADPNGTAAVEISVAGRSADRPGLADLLSTVAASVRPVP